MEFIRGPALRVGPFHTGRRELIFVIALGPDRLNMSGGGEHAVSLMGGPQSKKLRKLVLPGHNGPYISAGRLLYLGWHRPRAFLKKCGQQGPLNLWLAADGRRAMERAAYLLPSLDAAPPEAPAVFFLTGRRFWYQTAFCGHTLLSQAGKPLRVIAFDDGTLQADQAAQLRRIFCGLQLVSSAESDRKLDKYLPFEH